MRNVRLRGKHKLEDKWDRDMYFVVSRFRDLPVYTVRSETSANGPTRTLHRDLLLPCPIPPACDDQHLVPVTSPSHPCTRSQKSAEADPSGDLSEGEYEWDVPGVQIQPAIFQFQTSPIESPCEFKPQSWSWLNLEFYLPLSLKMCVSKCRCSLT